MYNVLFLCTGNSARSILAEAWGIPDPDAVPGTDEERRRAFRNAFLALRRRIELFAALPFEKLSRLALQERLREIGRQ